MISIIGIGEDGLLGVQASLHHLIQNADVLVGGQRHLDMVESNATKITWGDGLNHGISEIKRLKEGHEIVVLATGEPLWFGIGSTLLRHFETDEVKVYPHQGAFSLISSRLGWGLQHCECLTIHGRKLENLIRYFQPDQKLLILSRDGQSPNELATLLRRLGFENSILHVYEHLGATDEKSYSNTAQNWDQEVAALNTIALECVQTNTSRKIPLVAGLDDDLFIHDGQLTKREVRSVTLSALAPQTQELLWDVGAGCGSISIEWMLAHPTCQAIAIEQDQRRREMITENAYTLGTPTLEVVDGCAPDGLSSLRRPDAIFIGGGLSKEGVFESCWDALKDGGRLVANAVTLEAEQKMLHLADKFDGELCRIGIAREHKVGRMRTLKPMAPVLQLVLRKG